MTTTQNQMVRVSTDYNQVVPRRLKPALNSVIDPVRHTFNKAGESLLACAIKQGWSHEDRKKAHGYLKQLCFGQIDSEMVAEMSKTVRRSVELRFATSCWFQRNTLKRSTLEGMSGQFFNHDYASAKKKFTRGA
jgi:hypothetical protein